MSRDVTLQNVDIQEPQILAMGAELLGLKLEENVSVRYWGGKTKQHQYGIRLKDCPYDIGFDFKKVKNENGEMVDILAIQGVAEFLEIKDETSPFYSAAKNGLDLVGFGCDTLHQAYNAALGIAIADSRGWTYSVELLTDKTFVVEFDMGS